jgi:hypothetical protein
MAMIAITTTSSISVNAFRQEARMTCPHEDGISSAARTVCARQRRQHML